MSENTILDLDALLDASLDNVADLPDYINPPTGLYVIDVDNAEIKAPKSAKDKDGNKKASTIVVTYKVAETVETEGVPVPVGSLFSERFQGTQEGLEYFKRKAKNILNTDDLTGVPLKDILAELKNQKGLKGKVITAMTKADDGKTYENCNVRFLHEQAPAA
jgi:hypothetical protein